MVDIPRSVRVNTGEQGQVYRQIDEFFRSAYDELVKRLDIPPEFCIESPVSRFEIRVQGLYRHGEEDVPLDDKVHTLRYMDNVVAAVMETRTEFNHVQFDFFSDLERAVEDIINTRGALPKFP